LLNPVANEKTKNKDGREYWKIKNPIKTHRGMLGIKMKLFDTNKQTIKNGVCWVVIRGTQTVLAFVFLYTATADNTMIHKLLTLGLIVFGMDILEKILTSVRGYEGWW